MTYVDTWQANQRTVALPLIEGRRHQLTSPDPITTENGVVPTVERASPLPVLDTLSTDPFRY